MQFYLTATDRYLTNFNVELFVLRSTSQYYSRANPNFYSPVIEIDDDSHSRFITDSQKKSHVDDGEDSESKREEFRHPRNCLLNFAADFYKLCSGKLNEINKVWLLCTVVISKTRCHFFHDFKAVLEPRVSTKC